MIVKISGETPFQVLSTQFSIGPSTSGYDLYFSADGVNYTQLFTVGANVNRQVTQVAAGSYYKLVGNTGNVVVNWYGNCVVDSGGGGGYVLPVASQSTLGGVKIGSGITIDSGGTISVQGGSGAEVKTIELSIMSSADFTQEDISALTEMVEYLADFPVNGLPTARVVCDGTYYTLVECIYDPEDVEEQTPEQRYKYGFTYVEAWNESEEETTNNDNAYIKTFYLDVENVEDSYGVYWDSTLSGTKTPIILEEHYGEPDWLPIYNAVAQSAVTMGIEEFAKKYDIYIKKLDDQENPYALYQAVGYAMQEGSDWDEDLQEDVQTTWITFYTFENAGYTYWLLSTGNRGLGAISAFYPDNVAHPKSSWINIDTSGNVIDYNIEQVDGGLAQYNDNGTDYAFSMYLICTPGDAERYRGNLQNFRKSYNSVNGNFFFRFVIDIEGTEYEAEYYYDSQNSTIVKIVFQPYKTYLQSILNS